MNPITFSSFYDKKFLPIAEYFSTHRKRFVESWDFLAAHGFSSARTVLDVGGVGPLSSFMQEVHGAEIAETKVDLRGPLGLAANWFDLTIFTETIEHVKDKESKEIKDLESFNFSGIDNVLTELHQACRSGGSVFVTTPNANSYVTLYKWLQGEVLLMDPNHVREMSIKDLRNAGMRNGFSIEAIETRNNWSGQFGPSLKALESAVSRLAGTQVERGDNIFALFRKV